MKDVVGVLAWACWKPGCQLGELIDLKSKGTRRKSFQEQAQEHELFGGGGIGSLLLSGLWFSQTYYEKPHLCFPLLLQVSKNAFL